MTATEGCHIDMQTQPHRHKRATAAQVVFRNHPAHHPLPLQPAGTLAAAACGARRRTGTARPLVTRQPRRRSLPRVGLSPEVSSPRAPAAQKTPG